MKISIHAPTRGATAPRLPSRHILHISIHAPTRGATYNQSALDNRSLFQSTLLQEERRHLHNVPASPVYFNPRSYKRSDCDNAAPHCRFKNFNPRSYKRSDLSRLSSTILIKISIHAPTRGATQVSQTISKAFIISIHAPTRGAT